MIAFIFAIVATMGVRAMTTPSDRVILDWSQPPGFVRNWEDSFQPIEGVIFDQAVPPAPAVRPPRVFRFEGDIYSAGAFRSQLEVWAGSASGFRVARINVTSRFPAGSATHVAGAFYLDADGPSRVIFRIRSYDAGALAEASNFRIWALDIGGVEPSTVVMPPIGEPEETVEAGASSIVLEMPNVDVPEVNPGETRQLRIAASLEVRPLAGPDSGVTTVEILGDGHVLKTVAVDIGGVDIPSGPVLGLAPMVVDTVAPGARTWQLRVASEGGCTVRRAFLAVTAWD